MFERLTRRFRVRHFAAICLVALLAGMFSARTSRAEAPPDAARKHHARMMELSIRIAQAQGNDGKIRKYKSLARQQRARKRPPPAAQSSRNTRFAPW